MRFFKRKNLNLKDFDSLYNETISHFSIENKKQYCINLLERSKLNLTLAENKGEISKINTLIKAINEELTFLNNS